MENKKKLNVGCAICDVRFATEETLSAYEQVSISCATLISSPEARALLSRCHAEISTAHTLDVEGNIKMSTVNGKMHLTPSQTASEEKTILVVNGELDVDPGSEEVLKSYAAVMVNGVVVVPESMMGLLAGMTINGALQTYPDGCIRLESTTILDRTFALRAKQDALYYAASRMIALNRDIDFQKLEEKNVRFATKKLIIAESLVEAALPLFDEKADIQILPDGCAYLNDDVTLDGALVRRYGGKLYIGGDLTLLEDDPWLDQVTYLRADGDALLTKDLQDKLHAMGAEYKDLYVVGGVLLTGKSSVHLTRAMLERAERGLSVVSCAAVTVDEDVSAQLLQEKLVSIVACANVTCTEGQKAVIELVAEDVAKIGLEQERKEQEDDPNTVNVSAAFYTL